MPASEFLEVNRDGGLTHVIDKGLGPRAWEDILETSGDYIDIVKLGWGTAYVTPNLRRKLEVLAGKRVVLGGTFFEVVFARDKLDGYKSWLAELGIDHVEISDGTIEIPRERKLELIADFARDFTVLSEVGSKDSAVEYSTEQWVQWLQEELDAGAWKVITEAREGGTAGIFDSSGGMRTDLIGEIALAVGPVNVVFEAPTKAAQVWFIKQFGPSVNLGNIPPDEVIPLETLRRGLRGDTLKEVLLGDRMCLTCSWQRQSSVLVHMVFGELGLDVPVVELDTQLFFKETYETRDRLVERYGLRLERPEVITVAQQAIQEGPNLWESNPDRCCHIRKVEPLERALAPYDAWITGIRREQALTRADAKRVEWSERYGVWKIQPVVDWDAKRVQAYIHVNEIPYNPLHDAGYPSIGCIPCTRPVVEGEDERAGRWAGSDKLECGIHGNTRLVKESND